MMDTSRDNTLALDTSAYGTTRAGQEALHNLSCDGARTLEE